MVDGEDNGTLGGLPYYQFFKINLDARRYFPISKFNNIASRLVGGFVCGFAGCMFVWLFAC